MLEIYATSFVSPNEVFDDPVQFQEQVQAVSAARMTHKTVKICRNLKVYRRRKL